MFTLAVCAEMVFLDLPIAERVRRIAELGFQVEIWDWTRHDIDALAATGATFSSMTGYISGSLDRRRGRRRAAAHRRSSRSPVAAAARRPAAEPARHRPGRAGACR